MAKHETPMLVGLADEVPSGGIRPQYEKQSLDGVPDEVAAEGIVRATTNPKVAHFRAMRDVLRKHAPNKGFDGAASAYWNRESQELFLGLSDDAKELVIKHAKEHKGIVGYVHKVDPESFEPDFAIGGPDNWRSITATRVKEYYPFTLDDLAHDFGGPSLPDLPDPMTNRYVARDLLIESQQPYPAPNKPRLA